MSGHTPTLWKILSETRRIITGHPRHFSALSILFLLPVSLSALIYSFFLHHTSFNSHYLQSLFTITTPHPQTPPAPKPQLLISIIYIISVIILDICANISITYSTFNAFYDKPVEFIPSLKSIISSFFPVLATMFIAQVILASIMFVSGVVALAAYIGFEFFGFKMDHDSRYFLILFILATVMMIVLYLSVEWCLSKAVVVLESKWGVAPLRRSSYLVKGMRKVVFSTTMLFGFLGGILTIWLSNFAANAGRVSDYWIFVKMVAYVVFSTLLSLYHLAANTVLFVYCEAHEEIALPIDEETGGKYVGISYHIIT